MSSALRPQCPAAEMTHGTLSLNEQDVRCHVAGFMRDADESPCVGEYTRCQIWRREKDRIFANRHARPAPELQTAEGGWEDR
jgi:hypothetical protein